VFVEHCALRPSHLRRAICELVNPAPLCRTLQSVIAQSARRGPVSFQLVVDQGKSETVRLFMEMQDPNENLQLVLDGMISQDHHFAELMSASVTAEDGVTTFIEASRIAREHHVTDLENRHIYGRMGSGSVSS
jgi:hypothetical protein